MTGETLIQSADVKLDGFFSEAWEPLFFDCGGKICPELPSPALRQRYHDYLQHRVSRYPRDLLSHVRRVMLALFDSRPELVYAALTDLFFILESKGTDLRAGLLERCRPALTLPQIQTLFGKSEGSDSSDPPHGMSLVIRNYVSSPPVEINVLEEARELLGNGQVELAQSLLEQVLPEDPNNPELTVELLEIYRRSRSVEDAIRILASLGPLSAEVRGLWDDLLVLLGASP